MYVLIPKIYFSTQQLAQQRVKFSHKICFKTDRQSLKLKSTPTIAVSCRVFRDGNFLRLYKKCQYFFTKNLLYKISNLPHNNEFKNLYYQYQSFKDFNRVLFWKLMTVNCLFNLKKLKNKKILYYLKPERRAVLILLWLKNILKLHKKNDHNLGLELFNPLLNFICYSKEANEIYTLKLKIYKLRVVRG